VVWLTALMWPRLSAANNVTLTASSRKPREQSPREESPRWVTHGEHKRLMGMTYREIQNILRDEGGENGDAVDCCPTIEETTQPRGGRNRQGMYVELYRGADNVQRFYETSCRPDVLDRPCRFIDRKLFNQSRCVQKYSYSFALIKTTEKTSSTESEDVAHPTRHHKYRFTNLDYESGWALDHILVRSGCGCEVSPKPKKKRLGVKTKKGKTKLKKSKDHLLD
ncbi:hypothetical protein PV326_006821, partial [Microctonus aethiopoides]